MVVVAQDDRPGMVAFEQQCVMLLNETGSPIVVDRDDRQRLIRH